MSAHCVSALNKLAPLIASCNVKDIKNSDQLWSGGAEATQRVKVLVAHVMQERYWLETPERFLKVFLQKGLHGPRLRQSKPTGR